MQSQGLQAALPEQCAPHPASWHQGFSGQEAPVPPTCHVASAGSLLISSERTGQSKEIRKQGVSLLSAPAGQRESCPGCHFSR